MAFKRPDPPSFATVPPELKPEQRWTANADRAAREGASVIGSDLSIEGPSITMRCKGSLRVDGNIEANLHCAELIIGEQAVIVGSIAGNKVAVSGRVNGAILGDSVVLHSTAHVEGDISSCSLVIEQGATFDGRARKVTDPHEVAPQLQPSPAAEIVVPFRS
jgi:cytoskeletal protein CcmA (bactofilin family)